MTSPIWVIACPCGWSRMVPRSTPTKRRLQILAQHRVDAHGEQEAES